MAALEIVSCDVTGNLAQFCRTVTVLVAACVEFGRFFAVQLRFSEPKRCLVHAESLPGCCFFKQKCSHSCFPRLYFQMGSKSGKWKHQWTKTRASRWVFCFCLDCVSSFSTFLTVICCVEYAVCGGSGLQGRIRVP